ncbi:MAG TPA: DUF308 domain-containing protein [Candidatus Baltobacteraceae bacterium]|nr:DUF308 domain-containing protein [Candidatus Baltobacteraceae bacterium]
MLDHVVENVTSRWWTFLVRAVAAAAVAVLAFASPGWMTVALVYTVGALLLVSGASAIAAGVGFAGRGSWWALLIMGFAQGVLGIIMLAEPGLAPLALAYMFSVWLVSTGLLQVAAAITLRNVVRGEFWLGLLGVITVAFGFALLVRPDIGVLALVYTIGWYATLGAVALAMLAFRLKNAGSELNARRVTA